ncbi:hypothetical protein JXQ31_12780 [candidate division KSB1 bacterium]|nr:hypothetical protein [candidate division KSB1 bacterium]
MRHLNKKICVVLLSGFLLMTCGVVEKLANRVPVIKKLEADRYTVLVGDTVNVSVDASDPDEDEMTYSWSANGGAFINKHEAAVQWIAPLIEDVFDLQVSVKDKNGGEATDNISITVISNTKPNITITYPRDGQFIVALNTVEIKTEVTPVSFIDRVDFFINGKLMGTDTTSPFTYVWSLSNCSGQIGIKTVAYRSIPRETQGSDSLTVSIQGVIPIP